MYTATCCGVCPGASSPGLLNLKFLMVYSIQKYCKWSKPGGAQRLGTMLQAYNYSTLICLVSWARNEIWSCMGFAPLLSAWIGQSNDIRFCCWLNFDMAFAIFDKIVTDIKTILRTSSESSFYAYHNGTIPSLISQSYIPSAMISFNSVSNYHTQYSPGYDQYLKTTATNIYRHTYRCTWTSQERSTYRPWTNCC